MWSTTLIVGVYSYPPKVRTACFEQLWSNVILQIKCDFKLPTPESNFKQYVVEVPASLWLLMSNDNCLKKQVSFSQGIKSLQQIGVCLVSETKLAPLDLMQLILFCENVRALSESSCKFLKNFETGTSTYVYTAVVVKIVKGHPGYSKSLYAALRGQ